MDVVNPFSEEAIELYRKGKLNKVKDRTVCVCGHPMTYHASIGDVHVCTPAKSRCRCTKSRAILNSTNLRRFMYTTEGVGVNHALGKSIAACRADGVGFEWIGGEIKCDICLEVTQEPIPIAVDTTFDKPATQSTGTDKIICIGCYTSWISE